jgi:microcystin-dependent protein
MGQPFVGEIRMFGGSFPPYGWAFCNGDLLSISEYETLFNLIGTTYGGDGVSTFALPDLRGRIPMHVSSTHPLAESGGVETVTLTTNQIPSHSHTPVASANTGTSAHPKDGWAASAGALSYSDDTPSSAMSPNAMASSGGSQPHDNMQPTLAVSFIISLFGVYPQQS